MPSPSESLLTLVSFNEALKIEFNTFDVAVCKKRNFSTSLATNLKGFVPFGFGLYLKRINELEKLVTPVSNSPSKLVSTIKILSGSINVIFLADGAILISNSSPSILK